MGIKIKKIGDNMKKYKTKELCLAAAMAAVVMIVTMSLQIPIPAVGGYVHPGDGIIFLAVIVFGKKYGVWAGSIGACLADIITGFAIWGPFSFVIKGVMAFVCGKIAEKDKNKAWISPVKIFAVFAGILVSTAGYYAVGAMFLRSFSAAFLSIPSDLIQGAVAMAVYLAISGVLMSNKKALSIKKH